MKINDEEFYTSLPILNNFRSISDINNFKTMPDSWFVAMTDVEGSTKAIEAGRYKDVNTIGASSIIAILNLTKSFSLPFIFGGDGATICIPPSLLKKTRKALVGIKQMAKQEFGMNLRVGVIPVEDIHATENSVMVSRIRLSKHSIQAAFAGGGIQYAEKCLKQFPKYTLELSDEEPEADFTGLECRWKNVPSERGEIVSIIIASLNGSPKISGKIYNEAIAKIEEIYGDDSVCHPIAMNTLKMSLSSKVLSYESKVRTFNKKLIDKIKYRVDQIYRILIGIFIMNRKITINNFNWGEYKDQLIANTDFKKFDDQLRLVLSGTSEQRQTLSNYLDSKYKNGELVYGIHNAPTALITCMIFNYNGQHIHLVDGDNGGYALAAKQLKKQLKEISNSD